MSKNSAVELSVIIPVGYRQADLVDLYEEYRAGLDALGLRYETIFVLDGPQLRAAPRVQQVLATHANVSAVQLSRFYGEATALMAGFERASGNLILTLPAYSQIESRDINKLIDGLKTADLCVAHRWPRRGGRLEVMRRSIFHGLVSGITRVTVRDLGCGARAFRRRVLEEITLYGDQHRFLAVLANRQGFRVSEIDVRQSADDRFDGRYGPREYARSLLDIFSVFFLVRFTKRPLRFFGMIGVSTLAVGLVLVGYLVAMRLFAGAPLADRPALLLSSLLVVLGLQLFALGLLGELIIFTHAKNMKDYQVAEIIEFPAVRDRDGNAYVPSNEPTLDGPGKSDVLAVYS